MDNEWLKTCFEEGITYHEDLGIDKHGFYCERVRVGPIERVFRVKRSLIDNPDDPCDELGKKRLKYLRKKVAELHEEIKNAMSDAGRYKFIRDNFSRLVVSTAFSEEDFKVSSIGINTNLEKVSPESVDSAIDDIIEKAIVNEECDESGK